MLQFLVRNFVNTLLNTHKSPNQSCSEDDEGQKRGVLSRSCEVAKYAKKNTRITLNERPVEMTSFRVSLRSND